ncbi:unnamed protein product [Psylliodes chrysocephalus]|uniref:Uncharacterized protein n=1 Tax=Psylliodes chrysocephalus TaxID=3402493 RepID=A0A9P0G985_9CUCU|nr:unnamed protein product [Psylliodes chrysocephala]
MERGNMNNMVGRNLDDITVDEINEMSEEDENDSQYINDIQEENMDNNKENNKQKMPSNPEKNIVNISAGGTQLKDKKIRKDKKIKENIRNCNVQVKHSFARRTWSTLEIERTMKRFGNYLIIKKLPGKREIETFLSDNKEVMSSRNWRNVKDFLYHKIKINK